MKVLLLKDGKWQEYSKELLDQDQAYKFIAWIIEELILIAPEKVDGHDFYHMDIATCGIDSNVADWKFGEPVAFGIIRVNFGRREEDVNNRIVSWNSQTFGSTPEEFRPQIREALGLREVVYRD